MSHSLAGQTLPQKTGGTKRNQVNKVKKKTQQKKGRLSSNLHLNEVRKIVAKIIIKVLIVFVKLATKKNPEYI